MADPLNVLGYMLADHIRQRSNAQRLEHMHTMALYNMVAPARTLQHGRDMNEYRGTTPFVVKNAVSGLRTTVAPGGPLGGVNVYTVGPPTPTPRRRRRGRR
jgi:hypothetical protein